MHGFAIRVQAQQAFLQCLWLICIGMLLSGCAELDIGTEIRDNYESSLPELPLSERQHFSFRMY